MGAWSKMMTAPNFPQGGMHPPMHFGAAQMDKMISEKDEKTLDSPPQNDDIASFKALVGSMKPIYGILGFSHWYFKIVLI